MIISLIAAHGKNREIGKDNQMLWKSKEDFNWFKEKTMGKPVIMGSKTHLSIGKFLPGRINIVLTRNKDFKPLHEDVRIYHSIHEVLNDFKDEKELMVIGGDSIYKQFMPMANRLYITEIDKEYDADSFFPEFDKNIYKRFYKRTATKAGIEEMGAKFRFRVYKKVD
ncbi:dihydrofolate reductase [Bacillus phage Chotacabras]|nr:dihydrofolate reductase [Bacillus phage Chotacabras]